MPHKVIDCWTLSSVSLDDIAIETFGGLCRITWCDVFGVKGMLEVLRDVNGLC